MTLRSLLAASALAALLVPAAAAAAEDVRVWTPGMPSVSYEFEGVPREGGPYYAISVRLTRGAGTPSETILGAATVAAADGVPTSHFAGTTRTYRKSVAADSPVGAFDLPRDGSVRMGAVNTGFGFAVQPYETTEGAILVRFVEGHSEFVRMDAARDAETGAELDRPVVDQRGLHGAFSVRSGQRKTFRVGPDTLTVSVRRIPEALAVLGETDDAVRAARRVSVALAGE